MVLMMDSSDNIEEIDLNNEKKYNMKNINYI